MNSSSRTRYGRVPLALTWKHEGATYRATAWPEVTFERAYGEEWIALTPSLETLASARVAAGAWRAFLEYVPSDVRDFLGCFRGNRLAALRVAAQCPDLVGTLTETPALAVFVAAHPLLRGETTARWHEINAVFERGGVYALMEWLGLPSTRQALAILRNLIAADLAPSLLVPLRTVLWRPHGVFALAQLTTIGERELSDACALAA